eukprot:Blabericola_migrator_1__5722@NODE_28_length_19984_cov_212_654667_g25_i0_p10_GENE_NODE_28_length_19984_cov_212_654667_g25_i0NODE_28_length_19984_cov_212_654667_g25_i0_p10_ORF_typecomplete_len159_score15_01_NODE_28_length_19984_cov_212_654667_g25_i061936669
MPSCRICLVLVSWNMILGNAASSLPYIPYYSDLQPPGSQASAYALSHNSPTFLSKQKVGCSSLGGPCIDYSSPSTSATAMTQNALLNQLQSQLNAMQSPYYEAVQNLPQLSLPQLNLPSEQELRRFQEGIKATLQDIQAGVNILNQVINTAKSILPKT